MTEVDREQQVTFADPALLDANMRDHTGIPRADIPVAEMTGVGSPVVPEAPQPEIPEHILTAAATAVEHVITTSNRRTVFVGRLRHIAFGEERLPPEEFYSFRNALELDPRLKHIGKGRYSVERQLGAVSTKQTTERRSEADAGHRLHLLVDFATLRLSRGSSRGLNGGQLLGLVGSTGIRLSRDEVGEFYNLLTVHPNIEPHENGNFAFKPETTFTPLAEGFMDSVYPQLLDQLLGKRTDRPMTPKQLERALTNMRYDSDLRKVHAGMTRLAKPKRRRSRKSSQDLFGGKADKKGYQGRGQGKKVSQDSMIADMDQSTS
jgi:hypothetical protein